MGVADRPRHVRRRQLCHAGSILKNPPNRHEKPHSPADILRRTRWQWLAVLLVLLIGSGAMPVQAQLGLPSLPGPGLPSFEPPLGVDQRLERTRQRTGAALSRPPQLRKLKIRDLQRQHADRIEADWGGEPIVRDQVLAISPSAALLAAARGAGFSVLRQRSLAGLDIGITVLRPPAGVPTGRALERLRALDPAGSFDFNHIYMEGGELTGSNGGEMSATGDAATPQGGLSTAPAPGTAVSGRIGLIDSGVDAGAPVFRQTRIRSWGCDGRPLASPHGTAVASLMVGEGDGFHSAASGLALYAADVYCGAVTGGAVDSIADAFAWLADEHVTVVNISLVGPPNRLLERLVDRLLVRGHVIVAAVGNDGPAAPPLYPAAYPGVIGVTAVDARRQVLPEAGRGRQVAFAAPGADLLAAGTGGYAIVRGTSFASPIVAGLLAVYVAGPTPVAGRQAIARLVAEATDLGAPGPDPVFGNGLVGEQLRVDPARLLSPRQLDGLRQGR